MPKLYIITYNNGDYDDWDWIWTETNNEENACKEWLEIFEETDNECVSESIKAYLIKDARQKPNQNTNRSN